jgi:hypothetical protein
MSIPVLTYSITSISTDATHPTKAFDARASGANAAVGPVASMWLENNNATGTLYYFVPALNGIGLTLDANSYPGAAAVWGVLTAGTKKLIRVGSNQVSLVLLVSDGTATTAVVEPVAKV